MIPNTVQMFASNICINDTTEKLSRVRLKTSESYSLQITALKIVKERKSHDLGKWIVLTKSFDVTNGSLIISSDNGSFYCKKSIEK